MIALTEQDKKVIDTLTKFEHLKVAKQLGFTQKTVSDHLTTEVMLSAIGTIDKLSRSSDETDKRIVITLIAILWTYRSPEWEPLKDFLLLCVSRIGFPPSAMMIDNKFDTVNNTFSTVNSLFDQFGIACQQLRYEVVVQKKSFLLTSFQKNIWNKIDNYDLLGVSAPTSAGKSFILLLKCVDLFIKERGDIVYIVPTLSLVSQVSSDFRVMFHSFGISNYEILTTFYDRSSSQISRIFVLTQEKAIAAFAQQDSPFEKLRILIVDEIQNVERVAEEDDQRAKTLFDTIIEFRNSSVVAKTIISGPRIESIGELGTAMFGVAAEEESTKGSPVVNFTYAVSKIDNTYYFKQYSEVRKKPHSIQIDYADIIGGHGGVQYTKQYHKYLTYLIAKLGKDSINLIFSPTSPQARKTAVAIAESSVEDIPELESLVKYAAETIHPIYDLCKILRKGFAYHHGKTPPHIRRAIEKAIRNKWLRNIVCTTTLMQGVNLPAQTVFIRNPNLCIKARNGERPKLTNYEIANLRGRAGRLLKDFIGRTFVLDENSFEDEDEQMELFAETTKELSPGYGSKFNENRTAIIEGLRDAVTPADDNEPYAFLLTYIRQTALRNGDSGRQKLKNVGIDISAEDYSKIQKTLSALKVPKSVCLKNRYWDPFDLDLLYGKVFEITIPTTLAENNISWKLRTLIKFMQDNFPVYSKRYFETTNDEILLSYCINTDKWLKECPLARILSTPYYDNSDKIENTVSILQNSISFGLPMLLKPVYDITNEQSMFLRFIEMGAFKPITRRMIELNIPRETAIHFTNTYFSDYAEDVTNIDAFIRKRLMESKNQMDYWNQIQLETFL